MLPKWLHVPSAKSLLLSGQIRAGPASSSERGPKFEASRAWTCLALLQCLPGSSSPSPSPPPPSSQYQASQCYVPQTASAAGSVGVVPCQGRGATPYCCTGSTCVPDTSGSQYGGGCTTGQPACCPAGSAPTSPPPSPAAATSPPASPSGSIQYPASQCDVETTASAAGNYGATPCHNRGSNPYCCTGATCSPDTSGSAYGGGCTNNGVAACCPATAAPPASPSPPPPTPTTAPTTSNTATTTAPASPTSSGLYPAAQCDIELTADSAGSYGATACHARGSNPYCCPGGTATGTCSPDTSGATFGGGCTSGGRAACCPASSSSPASPSPSPPPSSITTTSTTGRSIFTPAFLKMIACGCEMCLQCAACFSYKILHDSD